jgi:hypothetical protein
LRKALRHGNALTLDGRGRSNIISVAIRTKRWSAATIA